MRNLLYIFIAGLFVFGKCNKDDDGPVGSFLPVTTGSNWTYINTPGGTNKITVTNKDTVALGRTYKVYSTTSGNNAYQAREGNNYYRFGNFPGFTNAVEELFLKGDENVNGTWNFNVDVDAGSSGTVTVNAKYTVAEKGISKAVLGNTYSNVTHIRLDLTAAGGFVSLGGGDFYYADGIGLAFYDLTIGNAGLGYPPQNTKSELQSYEIK